mgnify:CR=1 FL=1
MKCVPHDLKSSKIQRRANKCIDFFRRSLFLLTGLLLLGSFPQFAHATGKECVIIIQGYESYEYDENGNEIPTKPEKFTRNSATALAKALKMLPSNPKLLHLAPKGLAKTKGAQIYTNKADLLKKIDQFGSNKECKNVFYVLVGHGLSFGAKDKDGLAVGPGEKEVDGLFPTELAQIVKKHKKKIRFYINQCSAGDFTDQFVIALKGSNLLEYSMSSGTDDDFATFEPSGDPNQYYIFTRYFVEAFYMLITNPVTMEALKKESQRQGFPLTLAILYNAFKSAKNSTEARTEERPYSASALFMGEKESGLSNESQIKVDLLTGKKQLGTYGFRFYKIKVNGKCVIVGYVVRLIGYVEFPIATLKSISCESSGSTVTFSFVDENGKTHKITLKKDNYELEHNGKKENWQYRVKDIPLMEKGERIGTIRIFTKLGGEVILIGVFPKGTKAPWTKDKSLPVEDLKYDKDKKKLTFIIKIKGKKKKVTVTFLPRGAKEVQLDREKPYKDHLAFRYGLMDSSTVRRGALSFVVSESKNVIGALYLDPVGQSVPISGWYDPKKGTFEIRAKNEQVSYVLTNTIHKTTKGRVLKWNDEKTFRSGSMRQYIQLIPKPQQLQTQLTCTEEHNTLYLSWEWVDPKDLRAGYVTGFRIIRTSQEGVTKTFFVNRKQMSFTDRYLNTKETYHYRIYTEFQSSQQCECSSNKTTLSYSEPIRFSLTPGLCEEQKEQEAIEKIDFFNPMSHLFCQPWLESCSPY